MARPGHDDILRPSVLDRLIAGDSSSRSSEHNYIGVRELRDCVARDLEWLLNTKRWVPFDLEDFEEARESNLAYGVPDFSTFSWRSEGDAGKIAATLEAAIRAFEPRLQPASIHVEMLQARGVDDFQLKFRIDAVLEVDPIQEPVSFDTSIDFDSSLVSVRGTT